MVAACQKSPTSTRIVAPAYLTQASEFVLRTAAAIPWFTTPQAVVNGGERAMDTSRLLGVTALPGGSRPYADDAKRQTEGRKAPS